MISFLNGTIQSIGDKHAIIDVNGVGYRVVISEKSRNSLSKVGDKVKLYTHFSFSPRNGSVELYGFETPEELNFFELLTTVSGIGPKSAQSILSSVDLPTLQLGIIQEDHNYLSKTAGIGSKTAQRLVLELKSKVISAGTSAQDERNLKIESEAADALIALGYSQYQAIKVLKNIPPNIEKTEDKIMEALKMLGKK